METTKLIVEYLIVGLLVCLATIFLVFIILPDGVLALWTTVTAPSSSAGAAILVMLLPIAYAVGIVVEYLGMLPYEAHFNAVRIKRFPLFVERNRDWLAKNPWFKKQVKDSHAISAQVSLRFYGETRYLVLMKNAPLYEDIERHLNRARILRALTVVELLFLAGLIFQFIWRGINAPSLTGFIVLILLMGLNISAVNHSFHRYCRAIERSFKVIALGTAMKQTQK